MALHTPVFMQPTTGDAAIDYSSQEFRQYTRSVLTSETGVGGQQGCISGSGYQVTQRGAGANMSVDVASGLAFVVGDDITNQGTYQQWNDATVNVTGFTVPGSGTFHHRLVLQIQDKLANGAWSGYQAALTPVLDTGGGLPAEPNSAITLATVNIPSGSGSITNAMITDYRQRVGPVSVFKTADTNRIVTTVTDDPDLQLVNLPANSWLRMEAAIVYTGGMGASEGDLQWTFRTGGVTTMQYSHWNFNLAGTGSAFTVNLGADNPTAGTQGVATNLALVMSGFIQTGSAPCYAVLQWAQNTLVLSTATTLRAGSLLRAEPMG